MAVNSWTMVLISLFKVEKAFVGSHGKVECIHTQNATYFRSKTKILTNINWKLAPFYQLL